MKQKTYEGKGILNMLETCKKHKLFDWNSKLKVKDPTDLDSDWIIYVNPVQRDII